MNWYKRANFGDNRLNWEDAYQELFAELGREPSRDEVRQRMFGDSGVVVDQNKQPNYVPLM